MTSTLVGCVLNHHIYVANVNCGMPPGSVYAHTLKSGPQLTWKGLLGYKFFEFHFPRTVLFPKKRKRVILMTRLSLESSCLFTRRVTACRVSQRNRHRSVFLLNYVTRNSLIISQNTCISWSIFKCKNVWLIMSR